MKSKTLWALLLAALPAFPQAQPAKLTNEYATCLAQAGGVDPKMRVCMSAEYERQDKRLNDVYKRVMALQSPAQQKRLLEAQQRWIAYTDANCQFYADPDRGTAARHAAHECSVRARAVRAAELEAIAEMGLNQPAEPPAKLSAAQRAQWLKTLKWPGSCEERFQATSSSGIYGGVDFFPLNQSLYLVRVECYGGAYNPGQIFMTYQPGSSHVVRTVRLKGFGEGNKGDEAFIADGSARFDAKAKTLEIHQKGRGSGGCGLLVRYGFSASGEPNVLEARRRDECGNSADAIDPARWPQVNL